VKLLQSKIRSSAAKLAGCVLLAASFSAAAYGDTWDRKTFLTFSGPVEIPGQVLAAGKYTFRLLDSPSNRHIVQISNERQDHVYATVLAIPIYRQTPPDKTQITFYEARIGEPPPVRAWYYPGDTMGQEFIYPKSRANTLLSSNTTTTTDATTLASNATDRSTSAPSSDPIVAAEQTTEGVMTPAPAPAPAVDSIDENSAAVTALNDESNMAEAIAEPEPQAEPQPQAAQTPPAEKPADSTMPQTATNLALYGLLGIGAFAAAYGMRKAS